MFADAEAVAVATGNSRGYITSKVKNSGIKSEKSISALFYILCKIRT